MPTGTVRWFRPDKAFGYGFIIPDEGGEDVFVHATAVQAAKFGAIDQGDRLSFEVEPNRRNGRLCAVNLVEIGIPVRLSPEALARFGIQDREDGE